jgi:hypothetical protein
MGSYPFRLLHFNFDRRAYDVLQLRLLIPLSLAASLRARSTESWGMPALTRRRSDNPHREVWHVYFGDVQVGSIVQRAGVPVGVHQWEWSCGFFPGCDHWEHSDGTALDFFTVRREFEAAWRDLSATKTEADYQEWRDQRDRIARKYASWARGEKPPPPTSVMRCICGVSFDSHKPTESYDHRGHIYAAQAEGWTW